MEPPNGTLGTMSVLFTDMVGSTELRAELGDDAADELQHVHDGLIAGAVSVNGGAVVKSLGDGLMATFGSAADGVAAAVAIQQAVEHHGRTSAQRLEVRVGLSTGDVMQQGGDVLGTPVVEAARLCAAAVAGEIVVAELVRLLARGRGGFVFEPIGDLTLKGLPEPVPSCRVVWEPLVGGADAASVPLPAALVGSPTIGYVGRSSLLDDLQTAWRAAADGGCRAVLLAGEPGVGKTRTATELGRAVFDVDGAVVLFGRCDEDLGAPYQPFVEALVWYATAGAAGGRLGRLPGELCRLVPELPSLVSGVGAPVTTDPRSEEYRLFEAVASWLIDASMTTGLVLVLDDLHWAARPTLQLLVHVLRAAADHPSARLLVVATYRDTDIDRAHPLSSVLADLRRVPGVQRVPVGGLTADEVVAFAEEAAGHELDDDVRRLALAVHAETDGNAFFVGEVVRHLVEVGAVRRIEDRWVVHDPTVDVPEGVRDVVGRRLSRLSDAANSVLSVAAVLGREGSFDVVAEVADLPDGVVLDAFDEGVRARLLEETGADRYRFAHALVRTTLYDELSATRRRRLHRRVLEALEKLDPDDVVALAHHSLQSTPDGGDAGRAARYSIGAGEQALASRALADAETRFRQALELLEDSGFVDDADDVRARCGLGEAQRDQGDPEFRATLLDAARRAAAMGGTDLLVRAVLANDRGYSSLIGSVDDERVVMIRAALAAVAPEPSAVRAELLSLLSSEIVFAGDRDEMHAIGDEAEAMARDVGGEATLARVLVRRGFSSMDIREFDAYLARNLEATALADGLGDPALQVMARQFLTAALVGFGDIEGARRCSAEMVELADSASPNMRWVAATQAMKWTSAEQPVDVASAANDACLALGESCGEADRLNWWAAALAGIRTLATGSAAEMADVAGIYADQYPGAPTWRLGQIIALADAGRLDEARAVHERFSVLLDPEALLGDPFPYYGGVASATVAVGLGDADLAARVEAAFGAHRDRWGHYYLFVAGPLSMYLAGCAALRGDLDGAVDLAVDGYDRVVAAGLPRLADYAALKLVEQLVARAGAGDRELARTLVATHAARAREAGAGSLATLTEAALTPLVSG